MDITPTPPPPAPRSRKPIGLVAVILAAVVLAVGIVIAAANSGDDEASASDKPAATNKAVEGAACGDEGEWAMGSRLRCKDGRWVDVPATTTTTRPRPTTTTTAPVPVIPTPADYAVNLVVTRKACFGSAGCNVTVEGELSIVGPAALTYDDSVSITYQIDGGEDGPLIETIDVDSQGMYSKRTSSFTVPNGDVVPTATITAVR